MEYTQESFLIDIKPEFEYVIHCDDISGLLRLSKFKPTKTNKTRITRRSIPISRNIKNTFYYNRTGYYDSSKGDPFTGSYILRDENKLIYDKFKSYMQKRYSELKIEAQDKQ